MTKKGRRIIIKIDEALCNGFDLAQIVQQAIKKSGKKKPFEKVIIGIKGEKL